MTSNNENSRRPGVPAGSPEPDHDEKDVPIGKPRQPISEESQFMPDTGDRPTHPSGQDRDDLMDEAQDGFMNRYPPKGQTD